MRDAQSRLAMARLSPVVLGIALALLTGPALSEDKCRSGCHGVTPNTFKFVEGTTYKYNLEGNIDLQVSSAEGQTSNTKVKATVLLTQLPQCNQILRLQNVEVFGADGKKHAGIPNIDKPVKLNIYDGHLEDIICAEKGDTQVSLNIKRAVASMLQANLKKEYETDIFGVCPTDTSSKKEGAFFIIQKHRNLNRCSHRENIRQAFMSTAFNLDSEMKTSPVVNSDYSSEQKIKNGILESATVTETYLYVPFSVGKNGAKALVTTKLTLAGQSKEAPKNTCSEPKSIIFDNPHVIPTEKPNAHNLIDALKKAVGTITHVVQEETAKQFINVIQIMRVSSKADLLRAYDEVKKGTGFQNKEIAQQFFFNAITKAGTGEAVEVVLTLLKQHEIKCKASEKIAYLGLSFVRHATPAAVAAATELLDNKEVPREAYLGVGSLASTYCKQHSGCQNEPAIKNLVKKLTSKLTDGKTTNKAQENELVFILKSIKNLQFLDDTLAAKITAIANNKNAPNRLRVAALEACLADGCNNKCRDVSINIMKDVQQDSEIRIKAYLTAASCPNGKVAAAVKKVLEDEPKSVQVTGYIVSHIKNIKASANPDKALAKQHFGNIHLPMKHPIDFRRFSHNYELSHSINTLGLGSTIEADLIYSQTGFLPRSSSLNLTADVFGHRYNFLEVETRQENLEKVMEYYLGPRGLLRTKEGRNQIKSNYEKFTSKLQHHTSRMGLHPRSRRDVPKNEIEAMGKEVQIKTNELNKDLDFDLSVSMLGSEIYFKSFTDNAKELDADAIMEQFFANVEKGIHFAKNFDKTLHHSCLFMDVEFAYPTSMGFPLRVAIDGASSTQLETKGKIDIMAILSEAKSTTAELKLVPSMSVEVVGKLTLDAYLVEGGLKVSTNLYSSTGGNVNIQLFNDVEKGYDLKYSLPLQKQELISANHEIVLVTRELGHSDVDKPLKFPQAKDFEVCADQLSEFIGLTFCVKINRPGQNEHAVLPFPLDGHSRFGITINNDDLKEYHIRNIYRSDEVVQKGDMLFEVLGSKDVKLKFSRALSIRPEMYLKLDFLAKDLKTIGAEARLTDTNNEKFALVKFYMDGQTGFAKAGFKISGSGNRVVYSPFVDYKYPNMQEKPFKLEGQIVMTATQPDNIMYTFDNFKVITPDQQSIVVKGRAGKEGAQYIADISVGDGKHTGSLKGKAFMDEAIKIQGEMQNTFNPDVNFKLDYSIKHTDTIPYDSKLDLVYGRDLNSKTNKITAHNALTGNFDKDDVDTFQVVNEVSFPPAINLKFNFGETPKSSNYDVDFKYHDIKFGSKLDLKFDQKVEDDYDLEFTLYGSKNNVKIAAKRVIKGDKSDIKNSFEFNKKKYELSGTITHIDTDTVTNYSGDLVAKVPQQNEPFKIHYAIINNGPSGELTLKVLSGSNSIMDNQLKIQNDVLGHVKINFKGFFVANGEIKSVGGKGTFNILLDFVKASRKIKADSTFTVHDPTYNVDVTVFTNFEKDNSKKYVFSSHNQVEQNGVTSKSSFDYEGKKIEGTFKGKLDGDLFDGKQHVEAELNFPNEYYISAKVDREYHTSEDDVINGNYNVHLEYKKTKSSPALKFTWKGIIKNTDFAEEVIDIEHHISIDNSQGKNLVGDVSIKNQPKGDDGWVLDLNGKLQGSVTATCIGSIHNEHSDEVGNYKLHFQYADKNALDVTGNYDIDGDTRPLAGTIDVALKTAHPALAILKFHSSGSLGISLKEGNYFEAKTTTSIFVDDEGSPSQTTLDVKFDGFMSVGEKDMETQNTLKFQKEDPLSFHAKYFYDENEEAKTMNAKASSTIIYAKDKTLKVELVYDQPQHDKYDLDIKLLTPIEAAKNTHLKWIGTSDSEKKRYNSDIKITTDGKLYTITAYFHAKEPNEGFQIIAKRPDSKIYEITYTQKKRTPTAYASDFKLQYPHNNFVLVGSVDGQGESIDSFSVKVNLDCAALKLDKFLLEAMNKGGKGGKKIQFTAKNANKNILSGSTDYKTRDENGKFTIEGSGSLKFEDGTKSANFKFSKQRLNTDQHGEQGIDVSFDASVGNKAVDAEFKMTNKHFRLLKSLCEEKKQCSHIEVDSKVTSTSNSYEHVLEANVDLRKIGLSHEFGLKTVSTLKGYLLDHTMDVHFESQDKSKYQYSYYHHPTKAGATLTTPKRIMAVEVGYTPLNKAKTSGLQAHVYVFPDKKNKPNEKAALDALAEFFKDDQNEKCNLELKFSSPGLGNPLTLEFNSKRVGPHFEYTGAVDVFSRPNQKIVTNGELNYDNKHIAGVINIKSPGMNIDIGITDTISLDVDKHQFKYNYDLKFHFDKLKFHSATKLELEENEIKALLKLFDKNIVSYNLKRTPVKDSLVLDNTVQLFDLQPIVGHVELQSYKSFKMTIYGKNTPNNKLVVTSVFTPGQIVSNNVEYFNNGKKVELGHASMKLDEANFLKSDYDVNVEQIKAGAEHVKKDVMQAVKSQKEIVEKVAKESSAYPQQVVEAISKAAPDFKPVKEYYAGEFDKLKHELVSDKTLQDLNESFKIVRSILQTWLEIFTKYLEFVEKIGMTFLESLKKVSKALSDIDFHGMSENITKLSLEVFDFVIETTTLIVTKLIELSKPLHSLRELFLTYAKEANEILNKALESVKELKEAIEVELRSALQKFKETEIAQTITGMINQLKPELHDILFSFVTEIKHFGETNVETPTVKRFIVDFAEYLLQKINGQPVDDKKALQQIAADFTLMVNQLMHAADVKGPHAAKHGVFNFDYLSKMPRLVGFDSSVVNFLLEDEMYNEEQFFYNLALNPRLWFVPLQLQAIIVQGQHIFTFDGKHLTFPGSCNYLLARDAVNGNFTIAGTYANGFLTALTVSDKHNSVTVKNNGQVSLNNQNTEYPVHKDTIRVTKEYSFVQIVTKYGAKVLCDFELKGCAFYISGFYHGHIRGLLGNGNSEPFDDFTMPNGKIVTSEGDFGNSYKMTKSCKDVKTVDHKNHAHNKECTKYFTDEDSDLSDCFDFVPPTIFRTACDHGMAANVKDTVHLVVAAYATACNNRGFQVDIPDEFIKCTNGDKPRSIDESFNVKTPGKAADIVFVIDETKKNEVVFKELVHNVITDLNKAFQSKKIDDVEYHFIGYGGEHNHGPYHYTIGGKFTSKGKLPAMKFADFKHKDTMSQGEKIIHNLLMVFGIHPQGLAYSEAIKYPFRAHAVKTVVAVTGEPCSNNYVDDDIIELITDLRTLFLDDDDVTINLITPFDTEFSCKDTKTTNTVIGFNSKNVFTTTEAKKKPHGTSDLHDELKYNDYCVDYTIEHGGNVFITNNFLSAKGNMRKTFVSTVAQNIFASLVSTDKTRVNCECQRQNFYSAKNVCEKE